MTAPYPPISTLLPHKAPMVLLERIIRVGESDITCGLRIRAGDPYLRGTTVAMVVSLEYMAQATGVLLGLRAYGRSRTIRQGLLLSVRDASFAGSKFEIGQALTVNAAHVFGDGDMVQFACTVLDSDACVARAVLNVLKIEADAVP